MKISRISDDEGKAVEEILGMISKEKIQEIEVKSGDKIREITSSRIEEGGLLALFVAWKKM